MATIAARRLFVGGPWHGRIETIDASRPDYRVREVRPVRIDLRPTDYTTVETVYLPRTVRIGSRLVTVMAPSPSRVVEAVPLSEAALLALIELAAIDTA